MKKILSVLMIALFACSLSHAAMTDKQLVRQFKSLYEDRKELNDLASQRQAEEQALVEEYKVDECNAKRRALIEKYQALAKTIEDRSNATQAILADKNA